MSVWGNEKLKRLNARRKETRSRRHWENPFLYEIEDEKQTPATETDRDAGSVQV